MNKEFDENKIKIKNIFNFLIVVRCTMIIEWIV